MKNKKLKPMRLRKVGKKTTKSFNEWIAYINNSLNNTYEKIKSKQ